MHAIERAARRRTCLGPLKRTTVEAEVAPDQYEALYRIGAPGSIDDGPRAALAHGLAVLDPGSHPSTGDPRDQDPGRYSRP